MTDQQPYEPTTDDILRCYMQRGGSEEEFNRWYEAEMAAAEQRGAERALREAAESQDLIHHMYRYLDNHPIQSPAAVRATAKYLHDRADRIADKEGDE